MFATESYCGCETYLVLSIAKFAAIIFKLYLQEVVSEPMFTCPFQADKNTDQFSTGFHSFLSLIS